MLTDLNQFRERYHQRTTRLVLEDGKIVHIKKKDRVAFVYHEKPRRGTVTMCFEWGFKMFNEEERRAKSFSTKGVTEFRFLDQGDAAGG